ncbi:MAG TPA: helix-turn-helix transcriptional regulator [Steroidobacteraceae bacterium]|nr:helix-turn-helix transcriptional regulator [Steroidobacteraceae bacterium]
MSERNTTRMAGVPELVVLRLVAEREMYGYAIARRIKLVSRDALTVGEGVLYPALHALEARGLLRSRSARADGRTRIYYQLTPRGRRHLARLTASWRRVNQAVERILTDAGRG